MKLSDHLGTMMKVNASHVLPGRIYLNVCNHLTPAEARRVAAALVKEAERAEKKGRKK